jgi:hypothetical protein
MSREVGHGDKNMKALVPLAWTAGVFVFVWFFIWIALRLIRWAKRGSKSASLLGWGMAIPAAAVNTIPPPQQQIEEVTLDIQGRKNSDAADPDE